MSNPFGGGRPVNLDGLSVFIAMPTHRDLHPHVAISLLDTQKKLFDLGLPLDVRIVHGNSLPHHARTNVAWQFLKSKSNRLFWWDSDIVASADAFLRLLAISTELDIVAGAYIAKIEPPTFMLARSEKLRSNDWGCVALDGLGLGFCCMTRKVLEASAAAAPVKRLNTIKEPVPHMFHFGDRDSPDAEGEDIAFLENAKRLGFQTWVDPTIELGHVGPKIYRAKLKDFLRKEDANGTD